YDELLVPALIYARRDRQRGELTEDDEQFILRATQEVLEELREGQADAVTDQSTAAAQEGGAQARPPKVCILGCPARDEADQTALDMLHRVLDPARWEVKVISAQLLSAEQVARAEE